MFVFITSKMFVLVILLALLTLLLIYLYYRGSADQASLGQIEQLPDLKAEDWVLVFSPHPDDETAAVGGYIYSAREMGAMVRVVLATDGNQLGLGERRFQEFVKSLNCLGVPADQLCCLGYPDTRLSRYRSELEAEVSREIEDFKPSVIICSSPDDLHPDHRTLGRVILNIKSSSQIYTYLVHYPWWPQMRVLAGKHHLLPPCRLASQRNWACFSLTSTAYLTKKSALSLYKTQLYNPFIRPKLLRLLQHNEIFTIYRNG